MGSYFDANGFVHGFVRDANGNVTEFDPPGATSTCFGTFPNGINPVGDISVYYYDSQCNVHGFLRQQNGAFTVVDVPGYIATYAVSINDGGSITGSVVDNLGGEHGFVRDNRGAFTIFDLVPGVRDYFPADISPAGVVVASYYDGNLVSHGLLRAPDGTLTIIYAPGAGKGSFQGTLVTSINPAGVVTGFFYDASGVTHGFLWVP